VARGGELLVGVLPSSGRLTTVEVDGGKLGADGLEPLLTLAQQGCARIHSVLAEAVAKHAEAVLAARGKIHY
jgi:hypothetical protein